MFSRKGDKVSHKIFPQERDKHSRRKIQGRVAEGEMPVHKGAYKFPSLIYYLTPPHIKYNHVRGNEVV